MRAEMTCARAEELLSDQIDATLAEPLRTELQDHLASCAACRSLHEELRFVVDALQAYPEVAPSATLAARVAEAALRKERVAAFSPRPKPVRAAPRVAILPAWAQSLAAGLALVTVGALLMTTRSEGPKRAASQIVGATVSTGAYLAERKDRLVEDVRVLRVVLETAFEGRVERVNERVEDYRKLLERRKPAETEGERGRDGRNETKKTNDGRDTFPNSPSTAAVTFS
jgi:Putative zinc-finger